MKKPYRLIVAVTVLAAALVLAGTALMAADRSSAEVNVLFQGERLVFDVQPRVMNGRVLVPLRGIFEALGAVVDWDQDSRTVTAIKDQVKVQLTVDQKLAYKNGRAIDLEAAPAIINKRTMVPLRFVSEALGASVAWEEITRTVFIGDRFGNLPVVGSPEKLKALLASAQNYSSGRLGGPAVMKAEMAAVARDEGSGAERAPAATIEASSAAGGDYSTTNIQVQGVDEADIVKTDGKYIYQVNKQQVVIARAYPASEMKITSVLKFTDKEFTPRELYVDEKHLVVIGSTYHNVPLPALRPEPGFAKPEVYPPPYTRLTVKAIVYDISDKEAIRKLREVELEGDYVSSRKIGSALYLVANKYIDYYFIMEQQTGMQDTGGATPSYRDSAGKGDFVSIGYPDIRYFPGSVEPNYLLLAGLNLDRPGEEVEVSTYLGAGQNIYASLDNLYVVLTQYEAPKETPLPQVNVEPLRYPGPAAEQSTLVYKFALDNGKMNYKGKGEVPGTILNQFSMDEYQDHFRIATTRGDVWRNDEFTSKNNVYILDGELNLVGRLENIAPGEKIYSVRFMGDRVYMVTFKTVDPLFVIDLKDPGNPKILGALKIPGYSDYLHPYDEDHIIGFGKDTIEVAQKDWRGNETGTMAYYQGLKMAIFDVSDVKNPVEMFKEVIGDRGTESELLQNHKALLFARDKNLLAFPVTVMETRGGDEETARVPDVPGYGEFIFQGAYVYNIDLEKGFSLKGKITHLTDKDYIQAGSHWYDSDRNVERVLYIGETLYTLSKAMIKANDFFSLRESNKLLIP